MTDFNVRVGIVGAGENTIKRHIPGLQALEGVEIVGVCNRSLASSQRVADQFQIPQVYESWTDLIYDDQVDAVVIGTWPYLHCPAVLTALEAEKHVLTEARMAMNAAEAHAMLEASRIRPHLVAQVVPAPFTLPVDATAKRLIAEGFLGELLVAEIRAGGSFLDKDAPLHWRQDMDLSGLNVMTLGIWYESLMRWIGEATRVQAMGKTFVKMRKNADGMMKAVRIPDHVDVIAEMACGAQAHFQVSSVTGMIGPNEMVLCGGDGSLRFSDGKLFGVRNGESQWREMEIAPAELGGWRVEEEFINAIHGIEPVKLTTFEDGVKYMEFTEAVARSMASGNAVSLPL